MKSRTVGRIITIFATVISMNACSSENSGRSPSHAPTPVSQFGSYLVKGSSVTVGVKPDQPQVSLQNGSKWDGFEVRLVQYLMNKSGTKQVFSPVVTSDRDRALTDRDLHMVVATYSDTLARRGKVQLVGPYMQTPQGVLVREGDTRVKSSSDLKGKSVCATKDSTSLEELRATGADISTKDRFGECIQFLKDEQVDAVSTDLLILYGFQETSGKVAVAKDKGGRAVEIPAADQNNWMVGLQPGDSADCEKVLNLLRSFLTDQSWEQNFNTWFRDVQQDFDDWSSRFKPDLGSLKCVGRTK